jgi:CubicO group peptidase (beta-lactamase class C family)
MVLSHTSGMVDVGRDSARIAFEPGTNWRQSAQAFGWLGYAVERATGMPLGEVVRREVFEPFGNEPQPVWYATTPACLT